MKTSEKTRLWSLVLGVFTALVIVFSQVLYVPNAEQAAVNPETEQQSSEEANFTLSTYSLPSSSTSLVLSHDLSFIQEILFGERKPDATPATIQLSVGRLFKALFQFVIAPNAP